MAGSSSSSSSILPSTAALLAAAVAGAAAGYCAASRTSTLPTHRHGAPRPATSDAPEPEASAPASDEASLSRGRLLKDVSVSDVYIWDIEHLGSRFEPAGPSSVNVMKNAPRRRSSFNLSGLDDGGPPTKVPHDQEYNRIIAPSECILRTIVRKPGQESSTSAYVRAGPRNALHFNPEGVNAAIVTCGGLCPGLNNVVREITCTLCYNYGAKMVYGVVGGFRGFYEARYLPPQRLTPSKLETVHHHGGTILQSSRGGFDLPKILKFLEEYQIDQLYVIGGDGTHRGAYAIHQGCMKANMNISITGIPKTIDNDIDHIDRCFGFSSAVEAAQRAIRSAKVEATCNLPNGIGIVKLMGRSAGYISAFSSLGSGDVDLVLVPEVPIVLDGPKGCLPHLLRRVREQGYAVVVVAEGAGEEILGESSETDASGNKKLPQIGEFLKEKVAQFFKANGSEATVKYIDPSYMVRSVPANAADSQYCMQLAQNAVHGAMAGYTVRTLASQQQSWGSAAS
uniref:Phosphofructokinase domain-containing protein n=1 Tax=Corethron hystrix TaxID=216773 RepID=A0A7S1BGD7_9STRA|mmetsp:Transcript_24480/g.55906  ORF Transcript_24480/g.55906 Transcript_24480/m.55906 type:complete len:510 (+) Transcript_24480:52-1581(+)